jgi:hypothetical protein
MLAGCLSILLERLGGIIEMGEGGQGHDALKRQPHAARCTKH